VCHVPEVLLVLWCQPLGHNVCDFGWICLEGAHTIVNHVGDVALLLQVAAQQEASTKQRQHAGRPEIGWLARNLGYSLQESLCCGSEAGPAGDNMSVCMALSLTTLQQTNVPCQHHSRTVPQPKQGAKSLANLLLTVAGCAQVL
jgi:hypothetical protein